MARSALCRAVRLFVCIPILLSACTSLNTRLPDVPIGIVEAEQAAQEKRAFERIDHLRKRLDKVAHKVLQANVDLCKKSGFDIGVLTQTEKSFSKELRAGAKRELGLTSDPIIVYVRHGSVGHRAGLAKGDQLLDENGKAIASPSKTLSGLIRDKKAIQRSRNSETEHVTLKPQVSCDYPVMLKMSSTINAYANGKAIIVTAGMMNFVKSDDELAYIIGHELAHNTQSHIRKSITNYVLSLGGTRYTRPFEAEADYVGLYYMERAGFNGNGVEDMWRRLAEQSIRPIGRAKTHPAYPSRTVQIQATREEIEAKRAKGEALRPELRSGSDD